MKVSIGNKTDVGCVREINEDCYFIGFSDNLSTQSSNLSLLLVADGMGGQVGGEEASQTAVDTVKNLYARKIEKAETIDDVETFILSSFEEAHRAVVEKGKSLDNQIGTTLTTAIIKDSKACIGHVGDSRAYLIRAREIWQLTEDHTLAEHLIRTGKADKEEKRASPMQNISQSLSGWERD